MEDDWQGWGGLTELGFAQRCRRLQQDQADVASIRFG
jgi:hypothetical protein